MPVHKEFQFNVINQALEGIYSTIVLRDVLQRNPQINQNTLHKVMLFLSSNIGSITSPNKIGNILSAEGDIKKTKEKNIAGKTVERYISMLQNAFIIYSIQLLKTLGKNYLVDMGFRNLLLGYRDADR